MSQEDTTSLLDQLATPLVKKALSNLRFILILTTYSLQCYSVTLVIDFVTLSKVGSYVH